MLFRSVAVRKRTGEDLGSMQMEDLIAMLTEEVRTKKK